MSVLNLKDLPLGTSDFAALRKANEIYVDKTAQVFELACQRRKYLLSRPKRFGKSLLLSTFESLFSYGLRDFKGLAIENLWEEDKTYNVLRLDFSEIKPLFGVDKFREDFKVRLIDNFQRIGFQYRSSGTSVFSQLSTWMKAQPVNSLVILIDEYDAPLTACLNDLELFNCVSAVLSDFYTILKSNDRVLRFLFITGIAKFQTSSIFSGLNNLMDISLSPRYGTLLGFTTEELKNYFSGYLRLASRELNLPEAQLLDELTLQYGGFCFETTAREKVISPWSLLNFLSEPESKFLAYWFNSGGTSSSLLEYFKSHSVLRPEEYGREKIISLSSLSGSSSVENLSDMELLTQSGYLTIKAIEYGDTVFLDYPNLEVKRGMAQLYVMRLLDGKVAGQVDAGPIVRVLSEESTEEVFHILNRLFMAIDYQRYPVRDEASVRACVRVYFASAGLDPRAGCHNAYGRSELEVKVLKRHWVFEFKVVHDGNGKEALLEGIEQIRSRHHGDSSCVSELKRVVLVYSIKERQFVRWQELRDS